MNNGGGFADHKKSLFGFDFLLALMVLVLCTIGILFIYSSGINSDNFQSSSEYIKQTVFCIIGIIASVAVLFIDYSRFRNLAVLLYILSMISLVFLLIFSPLINGSKAWIGIGGFGIQPSEFVKITTILILARFIENNQKEISTLKVFIQAFLLMMLPAALVLMQPDLGTASVYFIIFIAMIYVGGGNFKYILFTLLVVILTILITVLPHWEVLIAQRRIPLLMLINNGIYFASFLSFWFLVLILSVIGYVMYKKPIFYKIAFNITATPNCWST